MAEAAAGRRLAKLYGEMSSLEMVLGFLSVQGVDIEHLRARDIYTRGLDCQNLGSYPMLELIAGVAVEYGKPSSKDKVLDLGCGLGGPGRFLVDRFDCSVVGTDLLPKRIEIARTLTRKTSLDKRVSYRAADATDLPFRDGSFAQTWMLDVSMHIRDKGALFRQITRVLRPGGMLVMHEQTAPIPEVMRPVTRQAPYIAPSLPQLIRYVDEAGLRVLTWRDTTPRVLEYFERMKAMLEERPAPPRRDQGVQREEGLAIIDGYIETLANLGGRTGILAAKRTGPRPPRTASSRRGR